MARPLCDIDVNTGREVNLDRRRGGRHANDVGVCGSELEKDVEAARQKIGSQEETRFSIFVLHNKDKEKKGHLPQDMMRDGRYLAAVTTGDVWICYPWEATDIDEHDQLAVTKGLRTNGSANTA